VDVSNLQALAKDFAGVCTLMRPSPVVVDELSQGHQISQVEPKVDVSSNLYRYLPLSWKFGQLSEHQELLQS
jgi:hypothetical protein